MIHLLVLAFKRMHLARHLKGKGYGNYRNGVKANIDINILCRWGEHCASLFKSCTLNWGKKWFFDSVDLYESNPNPIISITCLIL